jgi:hypothetical protein
MTPKEIAIRALRDARGDNFERAKAAFAGLTDEQMQQEYGQSGRTRAEILADYGAHVREINAAIEWVQSRPD